MRREQDSAEREEPPDEDGDLTDLLGEMRVLLPAAQLLSAFLITVPFTPGFEKIVVAEKGVFLVTFVLAMASLVTLSAPAVQHRLVRPLRDRAEFKRHATRQVVLGALALAIALVLVTQFVLSEVFGETVGAVAAGAIGALTFVLWVLVPRALKSMGRL